MSPPHGAAAPAPVGAHNAESTRPEPTARPELPRPPATAPELDETAEITDEQFWAYIRNEVGR